MPPECDVVVVGAGPVGMITALLLASHGHHVVVLERDEQPNRVSRAAVVDDESMRTLAAVGVADRVLPFLSPQRILEWIGPAGDVVVRHHLAERGRCGWPASSTMYQPDLDAALDEACRSAADVDLRRGCEVVDVTQGPSAVEVHLAGSGTVTARYAVACDGGESRVRATLGIDEDDHGFSEPWLICDFRLRRPMDLPESRQIGDPGGPRTMLELGHRHHRFSFLLDPDSAEAAAPTEQAWQRVSGYLDTGDADLVRADVHHFRSRIAQRWRVGRTLLAGDAVHRLPRQYGQGLSAGVHDAQNLAFKLDLVLRGARTDEILDSYQLEREPAVTAVLRSAVEGGRAFTLRDPTAAANRDRLVRGERDDGRPPGLARRPVLSGELFATRAGAGRGEMSVQGVVDDGTGRARLDQLVGRPGFTVVVDAAVLPDFDRSAAAVSLRGAGVHVVVVHPVLPAAGSGTDAVADVEGVYGSWLAERDWAAVAIRPDFRVFGAAADGTMTDVLAGELLAALGH